MVGVFSVMPRSSAAYDGDKHIYLMSGASDGITWSSDVDCLDIETQKCTKVTKLLRVELPKVYFSNDIIYVVGWNALVSRQYHIHSINVKTLAQDIVFERTGPKHSIMLTCFDGDDSIFILTSQFIRYSLSDKLMYELTMPAIEIFSQTMVFVDIQFGILLIGGKDNNHRYSIQDNQWTKLEDNDYDVRSYYGACLISNSLE
ncbi:hypothetical protein SAMD00019534_031940 [Acytostelium subglobosum LB1]|uniref:hypothetical protein n=1 Tax=Acytostelium subglobosum LB1 TaxID=1410327 RepID=UPI0006449628|nr:hypothetical protein SAMD00019534_031940 [Acytostelium subglobosum LB1]GAM20019.1 hypothetical protein SAMD00019534_031940 [Acytostelium subglobosum LB1]|eukprot:XP_012756781.1 hypothetical protein SAMD00019534_031940 [Acytostelium subglobosum LB1]